MGQLATVNHNQPQSFVLSLRFAFSWPTSPPGQQPPAGRAKAQEAPVHTLFFLPHLVAIRALCWLNYISKARRRFASGSLAGPGRPRLAWGGAAASSRHQDNQDEPRPYLWLFIDTGKRFVCSFLLLEEVTGKKKK